MLLQYSINVTVKFYNVRNKTMVKCIEKKMAIKMNSKHSWLSNAKDVELIDSTIAHKEIHTSCKIKDKMLNKK